MTTESTVSKADYISAPDCCNSNPLPVFVRADPGAGCTWGRVIHRQGSDLFCLTPAGVRYYGIRGEWEPRLLVPGDEGYEEVRVAWQRALATLP